jgi:hypothetical protein
LISCVRGTRKGLSVWLDGLSGLSGSSAEVFGPANQTNQIDEIDQMNELSFAARGLVVLTSRFTLSTPAISSCCVPSAIRYQPSAPILTTSYRSRLIVLSPAAGLENSNFNALTRAR